MDAVTLLREQLQTATYYLEKTMDDVSAEMAHQVPPGKAHTIAGYYAHYIVLTDIMVNAMLKGGEPLYTSTWAERSGMSDPLPAFDADWAENHRMWARSLRLDMAATREYARAVYASADQYIAALTPDALDQPASLFGAEMSLGVTISMFIILHLSNGNGEIAAIKGVLGATGYNEGLAPA